MSRIILTFILSIIMGCSSLTIEKDKLDNITVELIENPYEIVPMSAKLKIKSDDQKIKKVRISIIGQGNFQNKMEFISNIKDKDEFDLYGFFPGENIIEIEILSGKKEIIIKKINFEIPENFPKVNVTSKQVSKSNYYLVDYVNQEVGKWMPFIIDQEGNIRWYLDFKDRNTGKFMESTKKLKNGNLGSMTENSFIEYTFSGKIIRELKFNDYIFHHDWVELSNGNMLILVTNKEQQLSKKNYRYDHILEMDSSGKILEITDLKENLEFERDAYRFDKSENPGLLGPQNWLHANSIDVNKEEDLILISGRHQGIIIYDRETKKLKNIIAPHKGFRDKSHLLSATDKNGNRYENEIQEGLKNSEEFDWTWGQHEASFLKNGNILVFDNGDKRNFKKNTLESYSRVVEYKINYDKKTIQQEKEIKLTPKNKYYSWFMSGVKKLEKGYLINHGTISGENIMRSPYTLERAIISEVDNKNNIKFEAEINFKNIEKGMKGVYRSEKITL